MSLALKKYRVRLETAIDPSLPVHSQKRGQM